MSRLPNREHDSNSNDPVSRSDGFADDAPSEMPIEGPENYDGPPTSEETQPSSKPVKRTKKPRRDDPERERRYAEIVALLEKTPRPPRPTSLDFACLDGICGRTLDFLMGDFAQHATWQRRLWLSASDLNGSGYMLEEVIWWLLEAADAVDEPEKREAALKTIANAYMKPRLSARNYMKSREADQTVEQGEAQNPGNVPYDLIDLREQLWNEGLTGPAGLIQIPTERITRLRGILLDLDPAKLIAENPWFPPADTPGQFYANIRPVIQRHPLARHAEIRLSGTGLHGIIWLAPPVELTSAGEQKWWANVVRAVQRTLPADPNAPGITALTRPIGSINSKNGAVVEPLAPGEPIDPACVIEFVKGLAKAHFKTVAMILLGCEHIQPCPICRRDGTHLDVLDRVGKCYGHCGKVTLAKVLETIYKPVEPAQAAGSHK